MSDFLLSIEEKEPRFHSRLSAKAKHYPYSIWKSKRSPVFERKYVFRCEDDLDINTMKQAKNTWFFREPLSAIVTVSEDGKIKIEGASTSWVYDIEPDWTASGMVPQIEDHEIRLDLSK